VGSLACCLARFLHGWRSVRGNSDEFLIRIAGADKAGALPKSVVDRGAWSAQQLGSGRIEYLRSLPTSIELGPFPFGKVTLVHATPWSTEEVVLPDAADEVADRMVREAGARLVVYGHIHTQYQRRVREGALVSVGAVSGSNDADPRPAYTILSLGTTISVEPRRVDWPDEERRSDYARAGIARRFAVPRAGQFPVRCRPGIPVTLWP